jgi:hypothetical protein
MIRINDTNIFGFWTSLLMYRPLVEKAIRKINQSLKEVGISCCYADGSHDFEITFISDQKLVAITRNPQVLGLWKPDENKIYIAIDSLHPRDESENISTIMHEMLHAMGFDHSSQQHSLMYETDGVRGLTKYEVEAAAKITGKRIEEVTF